MFPILKAVRIPSFVSIAKSGRFLAFAFFILMLHSTTSSGMQSYRFSLSLQDVEKLGKFQIFPIACKLATDSDYLKIIESAKNVDPVGLPDLAAACTNAPRSLKQKLLETLLYSFGKKINESTGDKERWSSKFNIYIQRSMAHNYNVNFLSVGGLSYYFNVVYVVCEGKVSRISDFAYKAIFDNFFPKHGQKPFSSARDGKARAYLIALSRNELFDGNCLHAAFGKN